MYLSESNQDKLITIAIIGGGMAAVTTLRGLVKEAENNRYYRNLKVIIFERSELIGPGIPYRLDLPNSFLLNHELDHMGNVNSESDEFADKDFYYWVQRTRKSLGKYQSFDLSNTNEFTPRSLYGLYLRDSFLKIVEKAEGLGIEVMENSNTEVYDISTTTSGKFEILCSKGFYQTDVCVLATGNWFNVKECNYPHKAKAFLPYESLSYLDAELVSKNSTLIIKGTGLTAYDVCISALQSGLYKKVVMASRHGNLRSLRGKFKPYERRFLTLDNLNKLAGGISKPFQLADIIKLLHQELEFVYGKKIPFIINNPIEEIITRLRSSIDCVKIGQEFKWRSIVQSIDMEERNQIYSRLPYSEKRLVLSQYSQILNFLAPMPTTNATKILDYLDKGILELHNGAVDFKYDDESKKFILTTCHDIDGKPIIAECENRRLVITKIKGDVLVNASGINRDISENRLLAEMSRSRIIESHPLGGIKFDQSTFQVLCSNAAVENLYCLGQMQIGANIQPMNSILLALHGLKLGRLILSSLDLVHSRGLAEQKKAS